MHKRTNDRTQARTNDRTQARTLYHDARHGHCTFFAQGALTTVPGFTVSGTSYRHANGGTGSLRVVDGTVEFVDGALAGQAGKLEAGVNRLYNERRSRTVIDCESK